MKYNNQLFYVVIPLLVIVFPFIWYWVVGTNTMLNGESGIIENMTVFFLLISIGVCLSSLFHARSKDVPVNLYAWLILIIFGAIYFALEEISYGQHIFGWNTSEMWKNINVQDETNLHNVHAIFDQLPRALLQIAILIGGIFLPVYRYLRGIELDNRDRFYWLLPTSACLPISLLVILIRPTFQVLDVEFINTGEMKEILMALFIMIYCISIRRRLRVSFA
ncbi:MAG: hypothetical protein V3R83_00370 [Gammaproteobacteria bacterium]